MKAKKYFLSIFVLLLCSIFVFAGCTKAGNATPHSIVLLYEEITKNYKLDTRTNKTLVFTEDGKIDLYSSNSYGETAFQEIEHLQDNASYSILNLIRENGEYHIIMQAVSNYYLIGPSFYITDYEIPQSKLSNMYEEIDSLSSTLKSLVSKKSVFQSNLENMGIDAVNEAPISESFKNYLKYYRELIQKVYVFNKIYEDIYASHLNPMIDNRTEFEPDNLTFKRFVLSSALYLGEYYYLKQMVLNTSYDNRFTFDRIYDASQEQIVSNPNYDSTFNKFREIVLGTNLISDPSQNNSKYADYVAYYNSGVNKLITFKTNVNNYREAVEKVIKYLADNKVPSVDPSSETYQYVKYIKNIDKEVANFEEYILTKIMA